MAIGRVEPEGSGVSEPTEIRPYPSGPFLVRGPIRLIDEDGNDVCIRRRVIALCRCGRSRLQPLCDGTHAAGRQPDQR
jgi:Iron-binding zinc finger CDGSH type